MRNDLHPGTAITTPNGPGEIVRIKPGNFRKQDYQVRHQNGTLKWYSLYELQKAWKMAD